ncbi:hypothetical protein PIB30_040779 [Stylosanthes scabra]|uniref:Uncharacterized protein n=1 Tax=Stylosanthes scabra TaxID=79078 RepID=A0ABU6QE61_9FABA|nr:hypothetical protein [Stylosanthes scabra]
MVTSPQNPSLDPHSPISRVFAKVIQEKRELQLTSDAHDEQNAFAAAEDGRKQQHGQNRSSSSYKLDNESFVHSLHSVRFDPDRPYEIPIEALMADKILSASKDEKSFTERPRSSGRPTSHYSPRTMPIAQRERSTSSVKGTRSFRRGTTSSSVRKPRSWELIAPSEGWMCDADDEKEIGGMDPFEKEESSEEDPEMEEEEPEKAGNPEDRVPATPSLPMDIDAEEDFQRYIEELGCAPKPSPLRRGQAFVPDEPVEAIDRQSVSHDGSSYNLSGVWQSQSSSLIS